MKFRLFSEVSILIAIHSAPRHARQRREVRSTWGENCNAETWGQIIFVIGNSHNQTIQRRLQGKQDFKISFRQHIP